MSSMRTAASRNNPTQAVFIELPAIFEAWLVGTPVKSSIGAPDNRACSGVTGKSWDDKSSRGAKNRLLSWKHGRLAKIILKLFPMNEQNSWIEQWGTVHHEWFLTEKRTAITLLGNKQTAELIVWHNLLCVSTRVLRVDSWGCGECA